MDSLIIDLILFAAAYVVFVYVLATMTRRSMKSGGKNEDDGDGGIEDFTPPKIDLPPGVIWPSDSPKGRKIPEPVEF
ncbi:hypothetical protein PBT90_19750 [Algoriphagus halophytocola]|uniref:Uncharacterized protein n=1 Tax=Algoriphagus halophytocola TaxID=2991499 RepID=A0ABY6MDD5_9BACT|nr:MULTISPECIES: hypothetical protein [unclassified Algoriphagus]UZD21752.1 hypothetical protein OM944_13885 [Algoriphagus sp. TR-M5]WBL42964.1 hypothetical protein PBT90_19750 [Algoriphagus sp. TR-M9]